VEFAALGEQLVQRSVAADFLKGAVANSRIR
jgi:hypothetical protein